MDALLGAGSVSRQTTGHGQTDMVYTLGLADC